MKKRGRIHRLKELAIVGVLGTAFVVPLGGCDMGEFTATSTVTLDGREVVSFLVRSWVLTPIEEAINNGVERLFDRIESED